MNLVFDLYKTIQAHNLILAYQGDFTQAMARSILTVAEKKLESDGADVAVRKRVFSVMVEQLQNIVKHNYVDNGEKISDYAVFLVAKERTCYSIMSGNAVPRSHVPRLRETLEAINAFGQTDLKEHYRKNMRATTLSDKGGAGLGFMDMAKRSGEKLLFDFPEISPSHVFFCLRVNVANTSNDR